MNTEKRLLKINDVAYSKDHCSGEITKHTVVRLTKTQAICDSGVRFKNKEPSMWIHVVGVCNWNSPNYHLETLASKIIYERKNLESKFNDFDPRCYSDEILNSILKIIENGKEIQIRKT